MWDKIIADSMPGKMAWKCRDYYQKVSLPYYSDIDSSSCSPCLFKLTADYFEVQCQFVNMLDRPTLGALNGSPVVFAPNTLTKKCFDTHMDIQQTWYLLCGLFDGALREMGVVKPGGYNEDSSRFYRELSKYAAELSLYGRPHEFTKWLEIEGLNRVHQFYGHPYSILGFYMAKCLPDVTAIAYQLDGFNVATSDASDMCDIPSNIKMPPVGSVSHAIGAEQDIDVSIDIARNHCDYFTKHDELIHESVQVVSRNGVEYKAEIVSYLLGRSLSALNQHFHISRRIVVILSQKENISTNVGAIRNIDLRTPFEEVEIAG